MCAISWPMAVVSTSPEVSVSRDRGRMMVRPAATGPETRPEDRSATPVSPNASRQRAKTPSTKGGMAPASACCRIWTVLIPAQARRARWKRMKRRYAPMRNRAVVWAKDTVREAEAGAAGAGAAAGLPGVAVAGARSRAVKGMASCGPAVVSPGRRLARGSRVAATKAATQTACRWLAGPSPINRQARAATAAARGICQSELSKNVSRLRLIVSMWFLVSKWFPISMWFPDGFLKRALDQFLNLGQSLRGQVTGFDQVQHQTIGRTSKKAV